MGNGWSRRGFFLARVLLAALLVQLWAPALAWGTAQCGPDPDGVFAGGNGTAECPYLIETADQLNSVRDNLNAHYRLIADIDLAGSEYPNWEPIGNNSSVFNGTFDGDGHKIINLTINWQGQSYVGLFGNTGNSAVIRNVGLEKANVNGYYYYTGGLVGYLRGDIMNSFVEGNVRGSQFVGGLAGYNFGRISDSYAEVAVTASSAGAGGLAGYNVATITDSYAAGTVSSTNDNAGGLVGLNDGTIQNSFATVNVTARDWVGGLAGSSTQRIERSFATGSVSGRNGVGGLAGNLNTNGSITDAYAAGAVTGTQNVGGLVGQSNTSGNITKAYATGEVNGDSDVGGLVGKHERGGISDSYYDSNTTGQDNGPGTPKTTDELKRYATFAGWDFTNVWHIHDGQTYPRLRWEEASWDDYSGFAVVLEEEGDKVYGEAFNLTITEAKGEFGQLLDGEVQVTVAVVDGDVIYDESVEFAGGNATVTVKLEAKGEHQLVVQVDGVAEGQTLAVDVIARLVSIAVTTPPSKTAYFTGESLDLGGLVVTGTWSDGSEETLEVAEEHISGFDSSAPATGQVVTITYEGLTATFTVTIEEAPDNGGGGDTGEDSGDDTGDDTGDGDGGNSGGGDLPDPPVLRALHVTVKHEVFDYGGELEDQRTFTIGITPDILSIVVDAEADEDVAFVVSTPDGSLESTGTAHAEIPVPEDGGMEISLILFKPGADEPTVYTLIIYRMTPDDLVSGISWNKLKASDEGYEYRFVTSGTTAGTLKSEFEQFLPDVSVRIQNRDGDPVPDHEQVASGARVFLTRDDKYQYLDVILLSDHVREKTGRDESERITLMAIVGYVIGEPEDVNGDGVFDRQDVRLLLGEIV
jgi:Bacterial Ig-like domain (group 3)./The GLUG motif.